MISLRNNFSIIVFFNFFIFFLPFSIISSHAENNEEGDNNKSSSPINLPLEKPTYYLDKIEKGVSGTVVEFSNDVDSIFSGKPKGKAINDSQLKLSWLMVKAEGEDIVHSPEVDLRLVLPRTEKKFQVIVERRAKQVSDVFQEKEGTSQSKTSESELGDKESVLTAGVRYILLQRDNWNVYSEGGIKVKIPLQPFAGLSGGRKFILSDNWVLNFQSGFRWYLDQGLSETTTLDLDRLFGSRFLFRIGNSLTWVDETGQLNTSHGPRLFHKINEKSGLRYFISAMGKKNPKMHIYNYEGGAYYRRTIYKNWVSYETGVKGQFSREKKWEFVPSVSFKLEMLIGGT